MKGRLVQVVLWLVLVGIVGHTQAAVQVARSLAEYVAPPPAGWTCNPNTVLVPQAQESGGGVYFFYFDSAIPGPAALPLGLANNQVVYIGVSEDRTGGRVNDHIRTQFYGTNDVSFPWRTGEKRNRDGSARKNPADDAVPYLKRANSYCYNVVAPLTDTVKKYPDMRLYETMLLTTFCSYGNAVTELGVNPNFPEYQCTGAGFPPVNIMATFNNYMLGTLSGDAAGYQFSVSYSLIKGFCSQTP